MLHMPDGCSLEHMPSQKDLEVGVSVSFGVRQRVFGIQGLHRDALALQSCCIFRKQGFQLESARRRFVLPLTSPDKHLLETALAHLHQLRDWNAAFLEHPHVLANRVPGKLEGAADAFYSHPHCIAMKNIL